MSVNEQTETFVVNEQLDQDELEQLHQNAVNAWADASDGRDAWAMDVDVADLTKLTQELREWRARARGLPRPPQASAMPPE